MIVSYNSSGDAEVTQSGAVTRVVHGAAEAAPITATAANQQPSAQVLQGTIRYSAGSEVSGGGVSRYVVGAEAPRTDSVMATLERVGQHQTVQLRPGDESSRTLIETAVREGLVRQIGNGLYEDSTPAAPLQAPSQADDAPAADALFPAKEAELWQQEVEPLTQGSYDAAVAGTVAAVVSGAESLDSVVEALAEANGMTREDAAEYVETGLQWHQRALTADLVKQGLVSADGVQAFYDSLRGHLRLQEAVQELAFTRRTNVFRELALEHKRNAAHRIHEAMSTKLAAAGMQSGVDPTTGELLVKSGNGPWMPLSKL